ncbi:ABC-type transport system, involved in lipoprotein release, permease protein [alpha proteobacterium HIMB114]|nr:ABC-type transport system, involved in lipoprotein release, permease protein [alpha proteobacterium HIMB114]
MINKAEILIISRYLKPKNKDGFLRVISNFSFIGIMLGVATLIIVMSVMNGFRIDLLDKLLGYQPHISFQSKGKYNLEKESIINFAKKNNFKISDLNLVNNSEALILTQNKNYGVLVKSFSKNEIKDIYFLKNSIVKGKVNENGIGVGLELASKLSLGVGDNLTLLSNNTETTPFGILPKQFNFKVSFIFNTGMYEFDNNFLISNLDQSKFFSNKENEIEIRINNPDNSNNFTNVLKQKYNDRLIYSWVDSNKTFFDALKVERNVMFIILTLIIVVAAFNIISVLTILIKNKSKEISILRSIGFRKNSILKIFLLTGTTIGLLGTALGVMLGIFISYYLENIRSFLNNNFNINIFPSEIYFLSELPSYINYDSVLLISIFSILIVFIASLFPALSASKLEPIKNLKNE